MARVKEVIQKNRRRNRVLKLAKGYFGSKHALYRTANEQVMRSLRYAYRDRKNLKREMKNYGSHASMLQLIIMISITLN